ncbi:MAG: CoA transferase [Dehalococcoidia bacterium]|nr:CoA transferase [Dehalococcoidia bacterium]
MLENYRMLDLSRFLPGPFASHILADMGMDVVKVEETEPRYGMNRDGFTSVDPTPEQEAHEVAHNPVARNKRSIALNLLDPKLRPASQEVFYRLARNADVVLEGYRPGAVTWMGVDYEAIRKVNPRIIYCSITGYGQVGPYVKRPGHDGQFSAVAGLQGRVAAETDGQHGLGVGIADPASGLYAATAILAAIIEREQSGEGQYIDVPMMSAAMTFGLAGSTQKPIAGRGARGGPSLSILKCKDGTFLSTGNAETLFWANFCKALGHEEYIPLRDDRTEKYSDMVRAVQAQMLTKTRDQWLEILVPAETCVAPIHESVAAALDEDPQVKAIGMAWELDHPLEGRVRQIGAPVRFSRTPSVFKSWAPLLGEHSHELLREAGYDDTAITALEGHGIVKSAATGVAAR